MAYSRAVAASLDTESLLDRANLKMLQIRDHKARIAVKNQIEFLNIVAASLGDQFLGLHLAQQFDLRELGLLYYVPASSQTLGDALRRASRYSTLQNEGVRIAVSCKTDMVLSLEYLGVPRLSDRHQIEFFVTTLVRITRELTGRHLSPRCIRLVHTRMEMPADLKTFFGCEVEFGKQIDAIVYSESVERIPVVGADPYLNSLLLQYCDEAISRRATGSGFWRAKVENALVPLLPHGQARMSEVARRLGVSQRTLARRLGFEGSTFAAILDGLRRELAERYLDDSGLTVSEVAWLLGYSEVSSFSHAHKRWTGKTATKRRD